jgi:hypothetical protein
VFARRNEASNDDCNYNRKHERHHEQNPVHSGLS